MWALSCSCRWWKSLSVNVISSTTAMEKHQIGVTVGKFIQTYQFILYFFFFFSSAVRCTRMHHWNVFMVLLGGKAGFGCVVKAWLELWGVSCSYELCALCCCYVLHVSVWWMAYFRNGLRDHKYIKFEEVLLVVKFLKAIRRIFFFTCLALFTIKYKSS